MKTLNAFKTKFKKFFEKYPHIKQIPYIVTVVIPKYECTGERVIYYINENMHDDDILKYLICDQPITDLDGFIDLISNDIPEISEKNAFYIFDENNMVVIKNNDDIEIETIDYEDEIWNWY